MLWGSFDIILTNFFFLQNVFEQVNRAYEFLCSKSARSTQGPDPNRIVLLLKTQSILFTRCAEGESVLTGNAYIVMLDIILVLKPYKYAGYPMLITTIDRETGDDDLFSKSAPILTAASELAFHTMNNSALNAEELRRENGIPVSGFLCVSTDTHMLFSAIPVDTASSICSLCQCYFLFQ